MPVNNSQPVDSRIPIVNPVDGTATLYLLQILQQRGLLTDTAVEDLEALTAEVETLSNEFDVLSGREIIAGIGLDGGGVLGDGDVTIDLSTSGVTPGSYTNTDLTVDAYGRITAASSGTGGGGTGTVTSVALSAPTGFAVTGSPITTSGTLALAFASGYSLPTTASQGNWDTAYGWGDHASAGYLTTSAIGSTVQAYDADLSALAALTGTNTIYYRSASNTWSPVSIGANLTFSGGVLAAVAGTANTNWVPLVLGTEPVELVSNGAGELVMVTYTG